MMHRRSQLRKWGFVALVSWLSLGGLHAQSPTTTMWHLPLDPGALEVARACDSAEVMVPSVQPMTAWNRTASLKPALSEFNGISVLGEARQIVGDFRASSTNKKPERRIPVMTWDVEQENRNKQSLSFNPRRLGKVTQGMDKYVKDEESEGIIQA